LVNNQFIGVMYRYPFPGLSPARFTAAILVAFCIWMGNWPGSWPVASVRADEAKHSILIDNIKQAWVGDLDGMVKDRVIRVLVVYNKTMYFLNGGGQYGISYEQMTEFEKYVNKHTDSGAIPVKIVFIPLTRDRLLAALVDGYGDIAVANLTITPERSRVVDFSDPYLEGVKELLVTGPSAEEVGTLDDLSGKLVYVRPSSSYFESLQRLNGEFERQGREVMEIVEADENLEDADLLEMVNAGIIGMVIVDSHKARFWKDIFREIEVREDIAVNTGGQIAWAFRKNSPKLAGMANDFIKTSKKGTLLGNVLYKRYLEDNKWVRNSVTEQEIEKLNEVVGFFRKYADKYNFDWLMLAAMGYQESGLDHSTRSSAGAVGIMQLLPSTAADSNVGISEIHILENNVHAGTKYLRFLKDRYFGDDEIDDVDRTLLTFASYNAGPARISGLRKEAASKGLDPNVWFDNVEVIAASRIGAETVNYVSNIYKYYVAYRLYSEQLDTRESLGIDE
jgi:membrane-bound lytic murein transglycosylase MltF